jgi:hypothetical protein
MIGRHGLETHTLRVYVSSPPLGFKKQDASTVQRNYTGEQNMELTTTSRSGSKGYKHVVLLACGVQ